MILYFCRNYFPYFNPFLGMLVNDKTDFFEIVDNFSKNQGVESKCIFKALSSYDAFITIAIPTYRRVDTLKETLESVLNQEDFDSYIIYVIDNNPERNDVTENLMHNYEGGRISYYKNMENLGMGGNWNRCISLAQTKWVCLLHDDDTIDPSYLKTMTHYLDSLPNSGILQSRKYRERCHQIKKIYSLPYEKFCYWDFYNGNVIDVPSGIIYNREKALSLGGFNKDYYPSLDCVFAAFMSSRYETYIVNQELTWIREDMLNASKATETQKGWFVVDYYFTKYILSKAHLPKYLVECFAEYRCVLRAQTDMKKWGTLFELPIDKLPWKHRSSFVGRVINGLLSRIIKYRHLRISKAMFKYCETV